MSEFIGVPYIKIAIAAALPAVLYYLAVGLMVHMEALRLGLKGLPKETLPDPKKVLKEGGHLLLPLGQPGLDDGGERDRRGRALLLEHRDDGARHLRQLVALGRDPGPAPRPGLDLRLAVAGHPPAVTETFRTAYPAPPAVHVICRVPAPAVTEPPVSAQT